MPEDGVCPGKVRRLVGVLMEEAPTVGGYVSHLVEGNVQAVRLLRGSGLYWVEVETEWDAKAVSQLSSGVPYQIKEP